MITTLDCTFRDGGYCTDFSFELNLVNKYLKVIDQAKIDAVEIGFRSPPEKVIGQFGNVTDEFITENLFVPDIDYFGVMVNNKEMTPEILKKLFVCSDKAPINLVRVAVHFKDIHSSFYTFKFLHELGYCTTCNLMQAADKSYDEIRAAASIIQSWETVDILYLADSFGGMNNDSVNYAFKAISESWFGQTGFHPHNNKGLALNNSIEAIDFGVDWIDSTILGIGRGAGNCETEYLLHELNKKNYEFNIEPVYNFVIDEFSKLRNKYVWGPSLLYYLSAEWNIHPTFVQKLLSKYPDSTVLKSLYFLRDRECKSFSLDLMEESLK